MSIVPLWATRKEILLIFPMPSSHLVNNSSSLGSLYRLTSPQALSPSARSVMKKDSMSSGMLARGRVAAAACIREWKRSICVIP